jgi:hypothetical protein
VVKSSQFLATVSEVPGSIPRRYEIFSVPMCLERDALNLVRIDEELFEKKVATPVYKTEINGRGARHADNATTLYPQVLALKFADYRRSISRYSSLAD